MVLEKLEPEIVWRIFEEIIAHTPRPSTKEEKIREKIKNWVLEQVKLKNFQIDIQEDSIGNIFIKKPATKGMESVPSLLLQAHLDMVCETDNPEGYDFDNHGLSLRLQENKEWVDAIGTTLGADNGIGLALALAIISDSERNIEHGPLEILFTVNEEAGFTGASYLDVKAFNIQSQFLINLDSGSLGELTIGSVCGGRTIFSKEFEWREKKIEEDLIFFKLTINGLLGGHSGGDIHLPRANANKLICRILSKIGIQLELYLSDWKGGTRFNVIPRKSSVKFAILSKDEDSFRKIIKEQIEIIYDYYKSSKEGSPIFEPNLNVKWKKGKNNKILSLEDTNLVISTANIIPHGVLRYSPFYDGFVESSNNFAIIDKEDNKLFFKLYPRSILRTELDCFRRSMVELAGIGGWTIKLIDVLPEWTPEPKSKFVEYVKKQYELIMHKPVKTIIVHGGLETGMINLKLPGIQMVSLGPTIEGEHSPSERLKISDVKIIYDLLIQILRNLADLTK